MKKLMIVIVPLLLFIDMPQANGTPRGRYLRGQRVYKEKLWRCAMWWRRLGDITKSSGKRLTNGTDLVDELGAKSEPYIRRWLTAPSKLHPRTNCDIGTITTEREVMDLVYYIRTRATNPPRKPVIERKIMKRSRIRLLKTHEILRKRLKTLQDIKKLKLNRR